LIDSVFGMAVAGLLFGALYSGLAFGFSTIKFARENSRATQIMLQQTEIIRLLTWDQVASTNFLPRRFVESYYPIGTTNTGVMYTGQVIVATAPIGTTYATNMRQITVRLDWVTGQTPRTRSVNTYVTKNGMQNYVFDPN
jgi:hypothetical protein